MPAEKASNAKGVSQSQQLPPKSLVDAFKGKQPKSKGQRSEPMTATDADSSFRQS